MKILQRNLNRSTFVVWEMKKNVSVVRLIAATRSSGPRGDRVTSKGLRPARSPDLTPPDYFFGQRARPIWRRMIISYGDIWKGEITETNHEP